MKKLLILLMLFSLALPILSRDLVGTGLGKNKVEAKKNALDDLSTQIEVSVESLFHSETNTYGDDYEKKAQSVINLKANNVLLGVDYKIDKIGNEYNATAVISEDSKSLYENKYMDLEERSYLDYKKGIEAEKIVSKKSYFSESYKNAGKADTYRNIALILGSTRSYQPLVTQAQILQELKALENQSMDKAVVFFDVKGDFEDDAYKEHLQESLNKVIANLANRYSDQLLIGDENFNNIVIDTTLNSSYMEYLEPVYYNNKKLTDAMFKASITITFVIKDTFEDSVKGSFVVSTSGKSFENELKAMEKAISLAVRDSKYKIENYIEPYNY